MICDNDFMCAFVDILQLHVFNRKTFVLIVICFNLINFINELINKPTSNLTILNIFDLIEVFN